MAIATRTPWWAWAWPLLAWVVLLVTTVAGAGGIVAAVAAAALIATVFAAVYHAEVIALRVGEPFGTLVLALAVTVIETALIVSIMVSGTEGNAGLARDTVFAAVMIVCNGIVGLCLLAGGVRHREQAFQLQGASAALAVLAALTVLTLVMPNVTTSATGPLFSPPQLVFSGVISLVLYGAFVFVQTVRHRDYFLPVEDDDAVEHEPPPARTTLISAALLLAALVAVVGLAKTLTPTLEAGVAGLGAPEAVVGIVIAALVLLPEGLAALRAARVGARDHRPDDPGRRRRVDRAAPAARTRARPEGDGTARAHAPARRRDLGHRPDDGASGHRAPRHLRGVPVPCSGAVGVSGIAIDTDAAKGNGTAKAFIQQIEFLK
jgi:Ca2+:H+ antiporter